MTAGACSHMAQCILLGTGICVSVGYGESSRCSGAGAAVAQIAAGVPEVQCTAVAEPR